MKHFFWFLFIISTTVTAQRSKKSQLKADKQIITALQHHIGYLADDKLEGRRTGTAGEELAYKYIEQQFSQYGLIAKGDNNGYIQPFEVNDGKQIDAATLFTINKTSLQVNTDYFPFAFSANASVDTYGAVALPEADAAWFLDIKELLLTNKDNPHFDLEDAIVKQAVKVATKGASALLVYNSGTIKDDLNFNAKSKIESVQIPVIYINTSTKNKFFSTETTTAEIKLNISLSEKKRIGHNVVGYIDNGAANTVILGAHYDHLGYGEDHNSLYTGHTPQIHNGADDNASGTAALIELGRLLKKSKLKNNNYLLIAFSGEELGLFGSKYYTEHPTIDFTKVNYMINMDMVGRLNDSTHGLTIGGYGTSPMWGSEIKVNDKFLKINLDSSGTGPSDHTSFYRKDIPVLFFFTGAHSDYHKPSDDADKINYNGELYLVRYIYGIIEKTNNKGKLVFTKTREAQAAGRRSFSVSLGIMPDYTFSGNGVKVDGVSEGKLAEKAGIKTGDIVLQLGDYKTHDVQGYMQALGKFKKGDATKVIIKRAESELVFDIVF